MPKNKPILFLGAALAAGALMLATGCASTKDPGAARWLQRGEAEQLLAAQAARAEIDPDPDKVPMEASAMEAQGDVMASQGAPWTAMNQYRLALREAKGKSKTRLEGKIAGLDLRTGRFEVARDGFAKLTKAHPGQAVFWQGLGLAQIGLKEMPAAEASLTRAVNLDPSLWRAQNLLGVIYNQAKQPKKAEAAFRAALVSKPGNPALFNNLALSQIMLGDYQGAEASLRRALSLNPEHKKAANNLGLLLVSMGRNQEAFQTFASAEGVAQAHNNMGVLLAWRGEPMQAQHQFKAALQALPRYYPMAARHLDQLGERPESPPSRMSARPMVPLAGRSSYKARASAKPKAAKPKRRAAAKPKSKTVAKATAPAKPAPKPVAKSPVKPAPVKQANGAPQAAAAPAPAVSGAKPAPVPKPAPLTKEQRIARDKAQAQAEAKAKAKAAAEARAKAQAQAKAKAEAAAKAKAEEEAKAKPTAPDQGVRSGRPAVAQPKATARAPQGLWIQPDGTMAYGAAPSGTQGYGVVFGASPRD
ncbi:MAG: tetratricopeptide repeat protein [Desulfarculaceae bacterium]|nr:tetratricopeptide repeat protein [Desulfarculaceae bacterium]